MTTAEIIEYVNKTPELQSLLYDFDMLPEQFSDAMPNVNKVRWGAMINIVEHFKRFEERLAA